MIVIDVACRACYNIPKGKCKICKKSKRDYDPRTVEQIQFLRDTFLRCQKFRQESCGDPNIDAQMKHIWGEWK